MGRVKERLKRTRYFTYIFVSVWKIMVFFCMMLIVTFFNKQNVANLFSLLPTAFGERKITVAEVFHSLINRSINCAGWRCESRVDGVLFCLPPGPHPGHRQRPR